ncbi:MAG: hypothetical protein DMG71_13990 [Acidobacteria bacterium]|nr:MAG: hypothetical protein DMG71_13990 [Acidobacteriota bacterium]
MLTWRRTKAASFGNQHLSGFPHNVLSNLGAESLTDTGSFRVNRVIGLNGDFGTSGKSYVRTSRRSAILRGSAILGAGIVLGFGECWSGEQTSERQKSQKLFHGKYPL